MNQSLVFNNFNNVLINTSERERQGVGVARSFPGVNKASYFESVALNTLIGLMVLLLFHMVTSLPPPSSPSWEPQRRRKGMKGEESERGEEGEEGEERKNLTTTLLLLVFVMSVWLQTRLSEQEHITLKNVSTATCLNPQHRLSGSEPGADPL